MPRRESKLKKKSFFPFEMVERKGASKPTPHYLQQIPGTGFVAAKN
jgi:hypothetical protein